MDEVTVTCPNGHPNPADQHFCGECGTPVAAPANVSAGSSGAGWLADPSSRHQFRYWDGAAWSEHVADDGTHGVDPFDGPVPTPPSAQRQVPSFGSGMRLPSLVSPSRAWYRQPWFLVIAALSVLLAVVLIAVGSCGDSGRPGGQSNAGSGPVDGPGGEIWEWALGKNVWEDPYLKRLRDNSSTQSSLHGQIPVESQGFTLNYDPSGIVTDVTLTNDQLKVWRQLPPSVAQDIPAPTRPFKAYPGRLPLGLNWNQTAGDLGVSCYPLNPPDLICHSGMNPEFTRVTPDGKYNVTVRFYTYLSGMEAQDFPGLPLASLTVTLA